MLFLQLRMWFLLVALFGIIYAVTVMIGSYIGITDFYFYLILSLAMMFIQYMIGPKLVEWAMHIKYIKKTEHPSLHQMVEGMCLRANMPLPKIGIAQIPIPNAFAFGRGIADGRICVSEGILKLLDEDELRAVLGHELSHLKNRDVLTITLLSVIPMLMYRVAWHFLFYGRRREERSGNTVIIGLVAFIFYFLTNLLVLYASRIREYFADRGAVLLGNKPQALASSLYKLAYGSARLNKGELKEVEGLKAFFVNDPSRALREIKELSHLDLDKSGTIDGHELEVLRATKQVRLSFGDRILEILSTHPNMLKRIKQLSELKEAPTYGA